MKTETATSRKAEQSRETQDRLVRAARDLFTERGYARASMEELVARAGMTRGALYHQYRDKRDLFRAVFDAVEVDLGQRIAIAAAAETDVWNQLLAGARAVLASASDPAVRRIIFTDGPSVLGWDEWRRIDGQYALAMVRTVLEANIAAGNLAAQPVEPLSHLLVGAINEAALAVAAAPDVEAARTEFGAAIERVLDSLRRAAKAGTPDGTSGRRPRA
ncbi:MAG TPA: helix-turn-helix domain-containing protein [Candidatus Binatia bacterium]|nr:helix-turn-helix domain-containing protein [Candidatus Binatia bacterium]